jgi:hypothetical protein
MEFYKYSLITFRDSECGFNNKIHSSDLQGNLQVGQPPIIVCTLRRMEVG